MSQITQKKLLRKLLLRQKSNNRLWISLLALCVGTTLLLLSVMVWWNFKEILSGKGSNDSLGSTFLTIGKAVTNESMAKKGATFFTAKEIEALKGAPEVQDVGMLTSNRFPVWATLNTNIAFATEMFLEAAPDKFIDKQPVNWSWEPGDAQVPIILSSDFLNLYNYGFALSQGLPQLSPQTIQLLAFNLKVGRDPYTETYNAHIVGFSDRINSVLVPQSFIDYGNTRFAGGQVIAPSRLILKVKDPSDAAFVRFLEERDYTTNSEQLKWSKLRSVVDAITSATGLLAMLIMGIGTLVFILFIELTIAKAQQSLSLLLQLGYSPGYLSRFMFRRFLPLVAITQGIAAGLAVYAQYIASEKVKEMNLALPAIPGWPIWTALLLSTVILLAFVSSGIYRAMHQQK